MGIGKEKLWESFCEGISGIKPITNFDTSPYRNKNGGEVQDFDFSKYLKDDNLAVDKATQFVIVAVMEGIKDAGLEI